MAPLVVLVGPPGAGKSTVGRRVAETLGAQFRDTDIDVEQTTGMTVGDIFVVHGEEAFRRHESAAVRKALQEHSGVLALGGGAVLDLNCQEALTGHRVVFLDVTIKDAASRVGFNRDRPLLLGNPRAQWVRLMDQRRPVYEAVATARVDTDGRSPDEVADEVVRLVREP